MLVALGEIPARILIDGMLPIAQDQTKIHEFNEKRGLESWTHKDGWGIAYLRGKHWVIKKSVVPFFRDKRCLQKMRNIETSALLLHVRKASGSRVALRNTHPFLLKKNKREYVFCHNGTIDDEIPHHTRFVAQGETDSERLFYSILTAREKHSLLNAVRRNLRRYAEKWGTNVILSTKEKTYVGVGPSIFTKYYTMSLVQTPNFVIVSSEPLPRLKHLHWEKVHPGTILEIDNKTREVKRYPIEKL